MIFIPLENNKTDIPETYMFACRRVQWVNHCIDTIMQANFMPGYMKPPYPFACTAPKCKTCAPAKDMYDIQWNTYTQTREKDAKTLNWHYNYVDYVHTYAVMYRGT